MEEEVILSEITRKKLGIKKQEKLTEKLLKEKCSKYLEYSGGKIPFQMSLADGKVLEKYMDLKKAKAVIDRPERYVSKLELRNLESKNELVLSPVQLIELKNKINLENKTITLKVYQSQMERYLDFELEKALENINIDMSVINIENLSTLDFKRAEMLPEKEVLYKDNDIYEKDFDTVKKAKEKVQELTKDLEEKNDFQRFSEIYRRISKNITYDYDVAKIIKKKNAKEKITTAEQKKIDDTQNLSGLVFQKTVCTGFAQSLTAALDEVNIESIVLKGYTDVNEKDEYHAWNQVKIDGVWYNTDLTFDQYSINIRKTPEYCLKSDQEFIHHGVSKFKHHTCNKSYSERAIIKAFEPEKELPADKFINGIECVRYEGEKLDLGISYDNKQEEYKIKYTSTEKDGRKEEYGEGQITPEEMADLIQGFAEKYNITSAAYEEGLNLQTKENISINTDYQSLLEVERELDNQYVNIENICKVKEKNILKQTIDETKRKVNTSQIQKQTDEIIAVKKQSRVREDKNSRKDEEISR